MNTKAPDTVDALNATKKVWAKMTFGSLIRSLRLSDAITQATLARRIAVSAQFLSDVEHGRKEVGIGFAKKIATELGYSIEPLIELLLRDQLKKNKLNYIVELKKAS